jgi:RpiB/LacA/LacB family sugar-phosphate isomerase
VKIIIGSDHGGHKLKNKLIEFLKKNGYKVDDLGTHSKESCDYPLIGFEVAKRVSENKGDKGILICKTGVGMAIVANKLHGIRAAACYDKDMARSSREHNDCNIIVLAAQYSDFRHAKEMLRIWLNTKHVGERHERRVKQIKEFEAQMKKKRKKRGKK